MQKQFSSKDLADLHRNAVNEMKAWRSIMGRQTRRTLTRRINLLADLMQREAVGGAS